MAEKLRSLGLLTLVLLLAGCGPGKQLPSQSGTTQSSSDTPVVEAPALSDPAALEVVDKAKQAATQGHPDRIDKLKTHATQFSGIVRMGDGDVKSTRLTRAVWPQQYLADYTHEISSGNKTSLTFGFNDAGGWQKTPDGTRELIQPRRYHDFMIDVLVEEWFSTLVAFGHPAIKVYRPSVGNLDGKPVTRIKVFLPENPEFTAIFDKQTAHLVQLQYHAPEDGGFYDKIVTFSVPKTYGDFILPSKMSMVRDTAPTASWVVESREFPEKLDPDLFAGPKK